MPYSGKIMDGPMKGQHRTSEHEIFRVQLQKIECVDFSIGVVPDAVVELATYAWSHKVGAWYVIS